MTTDVVRLTEELVRIDSAPGRSTSAVAARVVEQLRSFGASVVLQPGEAGGVAHVNVIARLGGEAAAGLVLAGHMDTVPRGSRNSARRRRRRATGAASTGAAPAT